MSQPASRLRTVFRACVVNAVRGGEALMQELVKVTQGALTEEESVVRNIQQRNLVSDSLRLALGRFSVPASSTRCVRARY